VQLILVYKAQSCMKLCYLATILLLVIILQGKMCKQTSGEVDSFLHHTIKHFFLLLHAKFC